MSSQNSPTSPSSNCPTTSRSTPHHTTPTFATYPTPSPFATNPPTSPSGTNSTTSLTAIQATKNASVTHSAAPPFSSNATSSPSVTQPAPSPSATDPITFSAVFPSVTPSMDSRPRKRIRFIENLDVVLLKSVIAVQAHVAKYGTSHQKFSETVPIFLTNALLTAISPMSAPTWKKLFEKFKKVVSDHRSMTQVAVASSGVAGEKNERTQLLDDIVLQIDEASEQRHLKREGRSQRDKKLQKAGEPIRERSIGITTSTSQGTDAASTDDREEASETT